MSIQSIDSGSVSVDFQQELNPEQFEAVEILQGPVLVIAGAGSGKTRTLVYRVARLIERGVEPDQILLLTFTRKAAATMLVRASQIVGPRCQQVSGGTFHGFAHRMLRRYGHLLGYPNNFTILDKTDVQDLLHLLARQLELIGPGKRFPQRSTVASIVSKTENTGGSVARVLERGYSHLLGDLSGLERLISVFRQYKKAHALLDYDDLLLKWRDVLAGHVHVRQSIGAKFRYIMVDEYQDTNAVQAEIVRFMACGHDNVMVVGDDAQSIYSFRGANFKNILDFPDIFPKTRTIKLERNYRSTQPNLDCTNAIIANATETFTKRLVAQREGGKPPCLYVAKDERDQAKFVADRIEEFLNDGIKPSEIAVLFRAGFHSFQLEAELNSRAQAFVKRGGLRLVEGAHIKDLLSLLRLLVNPLDRLSLSRVLLLIERLGIKTVEKIFSQLIKSEDPLDCMAAYKTKAAWGEPVKGLGSLLKRLRDESADLPELLSKLEAWYRPHLERIYPGDYPRRLQELAHLRGIAARYEDAVSMLADLALDPPGQEDAQQERLILSTIHSAKGLEWKVVFVLSLAEGRFPSSVVLHKDKELEEERRLFYVAATRAKDHLFFCYPAFIVVSGTGLLPARPSRFLEEIPVDLLQLWKKMPDAVERYSQKAGQYVKDVGDRRSSMSLVHRQESGSQAGETAKEAEPGIFTIGARVRHPIFGPGQVIKVIGPEKVQVLFDVSGEKTLHIGYAKLSVI